MKGEICQTNRKMTQSTNILQELKELESTLADAAIQNIYEVPEGYFEGLVGDVLNRIKALEAVTTADELNYLSPALSNISKQMPYTVPSGYFEGLEEQLMHAVRESGDYKTAKEELETLSPLLSSLNKQAPYSVPQGYFETLHEEVRANTKSETRVISITSRRWLRYAAAAVITGIIALAGLIYFNKQNEPVKNFARFEKNLNKEIKKTSDKELTEFVQQFTDAGLSSEEKVQINPKEEVKDLLKDVTDNELKEFLEDTADPEITDISLMN